MDEIAKIIGASALFCGGILFMSILGATFGALSGWMVGLIWGTPITAVLQSIGVPKNIEMWQIGCTLGFVGSFLRTSVEHKK